MKVDKEVVCKQEGKVFNSWRPEKKKVVCVDNKLIHFGQKGYRHNYSKEARDNYIKRSAGIRDKEGNLTKNDKTSANYWARKILWEDKWD
jgi:TFIIF-interacting CTD phosphatase-like protein